MGVYSGNKVRRFDCTMDKRMIRVVRKKDEFSAEYQVGDVFEVESTWYGGVNVSSKTGIPLSLDEEEYEPFEEETERVRAVDPYSYNLGVMDCFCEMVGAGVKRLAMSHPFGTREERDSYLEEVRGFCRKYGISFYTEDEAFLTDLFPERLNKGTYNFLFFAEDKVLDAYLALKEEQRTLLGNGGYTKQKSYELAQEFGRLLSYTENGIERLIRKAAEEREAGDAD